jgi:hypothetical protein
MPSRGLAVEDHLHLARQRPGGRCCRGAVRSRSPAAPSTHAMPDAAYESRERFAWSAAV